MRDTAERPEERAAVVPGGPDLCQILQDVGDDVYQQYRLTRQGSDFDSQSAFHINVSIDGHLSCITTRNMSSPQLRESCGFLSGSSVFC